MYKFLLFKLKLFVKRGALIVKKYLRLLSSVLIISMLMTIFPVQAFAEGFGSPDRGPEVEKAAVVNQNSIKKNAKILSEVVGKREANVKTFLRDDMTYEANIYPYPVHYMENGKWKDADNAMSSAIDEAGNDVLQNNNNDYKIKIAKNTRAKKLIKLQKENYEIDWNIENTNDSTSQVVPVDTNSLNNLSSNDKIKTLTKVSSIVNFKNIFNNIDVQYRIMPGELKENIIINSQVESPRFTYDISVKNVTPKLLDDNSIVFYDAKDTSKVVFKMNSPFMYDANNEVNRDIQISLDKTDSGYKLTMAPNSEWLNSPDRKYPVTIDPPVQTSLDYNYISDTYVCSSFPTTNYYLSYINRVGWGSTSGACRSYLEFNLPKLYSGDLIYSAELTLIPRDSRSDPYNSQIDVHEVTSSWDSTTLTWNNMPDYDRTIKDYRIIGAYQA